jgi:hypothetical protein
LVRLSVNAVAVFVASSLVGWGLVNLVARVRSPSVANAWTDGPAAAPPSGHAIVVAELFTSEGCSSCPPADAVLSTLVRDQPLSSVEVVALGEHVDYWDHLGWRDPYSSSVFSERQAEYALRVFASSGIYTPQLVVDGQYQAVGSDVVAVRKAIVRAASAPRASVHVEASAIDTEQIAVHVQLDLGAGPALREPGDVVVAITQDRLVDDVERGENRGRRLTHSAVARSLTALGSVSGSETAFAADTSLPIGRQWKTSGMRIIAFLQERRSRRILGAGSAILNRTSFKEDSQ